VNERLREQFALEPARIAQLDDGVRPAFHLEERGRYVLTAMVGLYAGRVAGERVGLSQKEARQIEEVNADVEEDKARVGRQIGLVGVDVVAAAKALYARKRVGRGPPLRV
jgi:hypothetical protein